RGQETRDGRCEGAGARPGHQPADTPALTRWPPRRHRHSEAAMSPEAPVQRQLDAYNAHDLERFIAEYADDIRVFRPTAVEPVLVGKAAFAAHYANNRFTLPALHAELVNRIVAGNRVVDHERITGLQESVLEAIAVYEVVDGRIGTVWFF